MRFILISTRLFFSFLILLGYFQINAQDVIINEINYRTGDIQNVEFVELHNNSLTSVDLSGWSFTKGLEYTFASGVSIPAKGYIVVAADPAAISAEFGATAVGPFIGKLSNDGENIRLVNQDCIEVDQVEYDSWKEWPAVSGEIGSQVAVDPPSGNFTVTFATPSNNSNFAIGSDLSVEVTTSSNTINMVELFIDNTFIRKESQPPYEWSGPNDSQLANMAEGFYVLKAIATQDDGSTAESSILVSVGNASISYTSIQKINPVLPSNQPGSWVGQYPTPSSQNYAVYISNSTLVPVIKNVSISPNTPVAGADVRVKADFSQNENTQQGPIIVKLEYQVNTPGNYKTKGEINWTSINMLDDGIGPDSTANNAVYTAKIPASLNSHRNLVRYRVLVTPAFGQQRIYPDPDFDESNYAYYVYDAAPTINNFDVSTLDVLPNVTIITKKDITNEFIGASDGNNTSTSQYQGNELLGEGTLVYNGKVFDHINFRPRGKGSRLERDKPGIKLGLNKEHPVTIVSDCGESYDVKRDKLIFSGGWVNDIASHGLTESLIYKLTELSGALPRYTDYVQLNVVDNATETGNANGDFFGLYLLLEDYNGDYLEEHDFAEGNFWGTNRQTRHRFLDYEGDFPNAANIPNFAPTDETRGNFTIDSRGNKPLLFSDRIAAEIYGLNGNNYIGKHSYNEYYDSASESYLGWWGDMDNSFGSPYDDVTVYPRVDAQIDATNNGSMIIPTTMQVEYQNEFRSTYDLLLDYTDPDCNCTQSDYLVDQESSKIFDPSALYNWVDVDESRWPQIDYDLGSYAAQRDWYKTWFKDRKQYLTPNFDDINVPNKPTISLTGSTALDNIILQNSSFSDLQGSGSFDALEWRVGEWSDPNNPYYDQECEAKYEIETKWRSGEIPTFSSSYQIPAEAKLKEDRTYLIRVRYKDNTNRWSHWSDPVKVIATPADNPVNYELVINEIMYNPYEPEQAEFIEIYNASSSAVSLDNVQFNEGIDYEFAPGESIPAESYICIAKDSASFFKAYGYYPFADYGGGLSNSGELVRLVGPFRALIDTVRYDDDIPWPGTPDKGHYSLALKNPSLDNGVGANWDIQVGFTSPCEENTFNDFGNHPFSGIVINEIHYNPFDEFDSFGNEIESGTKFEFIELKNISNSAIDMTGSFFSRGIEYFFEPGTIIEPNEFFVLAEDKSSFFDRYGFDADDKYDGKLSNTGETLWLVNSIGLILDELTYSPNFPWDTQANGGLHDFSLAVIDGSVNNNTWLNWKVQCTENYTPGAENDFDCFNGLNYEGLTINELHYSPSSGSNLEFIEIVNNSNILMNLKDVAISGGIQYVFDNTFLAPKIASPNNYIVIAHDSIAFHNYYGFAPHGQYTGVLSNLGEEVKIQDLFASTIDSVSYSKNSPWNTIASLGDHSLALIDLDSDNAKASNWDVQCVGYTPLGVNTFDDADNDSVQDCFDECPGVDDSIMNTLCDDGDPCTIGESYDSNCNCTGGIFQDSDNDGICNLNDVCPNLDDALIGTACDDNNPCTDMSIYTNCGCEGVTNLALQGNASMSSQTSGDFPASNLNDGIINDINTELAHTSPSSTTEWVQIDLGSVESINTIAIWNRTNCCSDRLNNVYLMIADTAFPSDNNLLNSLTNADYMYQIGDVTSVSVVSQFVNAQGRYVRLQKSGTNNGSNAINLKEIQIFATDNSADIDNDGICDEPLVTCPDEFLQSDNTRIDESRSVITRIKSNGIVENGSIEFTAGQYVLMTEGFEVKPGSVYHAYIEPCSN